MSDLHREDSVLGPRRPSSLDLAALAALVAGLAVVWGRGRQTWYWTDEGLSLGMSSHPLAEMHQVLAQDTSPPLYHVVLRIWMALFGSSEAATHTLSLLFALAVVPAALWAGWSLFDRRTGWMCALVATINPFLATYANETRMYSLVALLSVLATATFLHAFVERRRRFLPAFAVVMTLLLYTHYWGIFLGLGMGVAWVICLVRAVERRSLVIDAVLAFGAVALLFAPWAPTLRYQQAHTAIAWSLPPTVDVVRDDLVGLVGGPVTALALALGAGAALVAMLRRPWDRAALLIAAAIAIGVVALGAGLATSRASAQWNGRYLGIVLAPILLALGAGLARGRELAVAALAIALVLSGLAGAVAPVNEKSNVRGWAEQASSYLHRGDLVYGPIGAIPLLAHYLPGGLRYATTTGPVADPLAADWRDAMERIASDDPVATLSPMIDSLETGGRVLVSCPPVSADDLGGLPPYIELEIRHCLQAQDYLLSHAGLEEEVLLRYPSESEAPAEARLLRRSPS